RGDRRHLSGHDDRDPGGVVGGLRDHAPGPVRRRPEGVGYPRGFGEVAEASPWPQETQGTAPTASGRDACGDGKALGRADRGVKMTPSKGCRWSDKTGITVACFLLWIGIATSKWHSWKDRYGKANEHNAWIPRDHWLTDTERRAILDFHDRFPLEGYRRLTFMMLDADVVACSPASLYPVLKAAGVL